MQTEGREWTLSEIRETMNVLKLLQHMGLPEFFCEADAVKHAHQCVSLFSSWIPVMGTQAERDLAIGEDVIAMAADAFVAAHRFGNIKFLVQVTRSEHLLVVFCVNNMTSTC